MSESIQLIQEKLDKEQKKLEAFLEQKQELDKKIQKAKDNVKKYQDMIQQKSYKETAELLTANNLTLEMIREAIAKGDLTELQSLIDKARNKTQACESVVADSSGR